MRRLYSLFLYLACFFGADAQSSRLSFRKLTVADGLSNGHIEAIGQDARGFLWFSSLSGLNRFDGYEVKTYAHVAGDSTTIPPSVVRSMVVDSAGRFLAGHESGLLEYDASADRFRRIKALEGYWVADMAVIDKDLVLLATHSGLVAYNPNKKQASFYNKGRDTLLGMRLNSLLRQGNVLYIGSRAGLLRFDWKTEKLERVLTGPLAEMRVAKVQAGAGGQIWVAGIGAARLVRLSADLSQFTVFDAQVPSGDQTIFNFADLKADSKGRIWLATQLDGLLLYNDATGGFERFNHDPQKIWSPSTYLHHFIFCDREGMLWIGGNNGVNYVNPDKNLFHIIPAFDKDPDKLNRRIARVATEDRQGNLWLGTLDGVVRFDPRQGKYTEWNNREGKAPAIYYNSIRGVLCDEDNNVWIATGAGINRYNQSTGKMEFFEEADSIPAVFYFSLDRDREGRFWFGTRDRDGFYYYDFREKKFHSIASFPGLNRFAGYGGRKLMQDSRGRYWLGFNSEGLGMYDPRSGNSYHWMASTGKEPGISGNIIVDIKEDRDGVVWISTFHGLSAIEPTNLTIRNFNHSNGLVNNSISALEVDALNRLWIGTGSGLMMLDSSRRYFTSFGLQHGLPSIEMPEHSGTTLRNGEIIMPTQNGYVRFNPLDFVSEQKSLNAFITSFGMPDQPALPFSDVGFSLGQDQNMFRVGFTAINFENADGTWYAYKLDGLDEEWTYTRNRFAEFSRVPGGDYVFRVKASSDRDHWTGGEQLLPIHVDTVFYKTGWFLLLMLLSSSALVYGVYRYRMHQQKEVLELKGKAQLLEKEKALAMYESLKQQLNPHFLFNSLTSLSGLIETDQAMAGNFLKQMSKIYRYILKSRDSELVTLHEEINFVQVYIDLQQTRFRNGLEVNIKHDEDARYFKIVPVTLQNMVENAIKHNVIDAESPLVVDIFREGDYLVITNNLQKKTVIESSNKQGLSNLQSLYRYLTKKRMIIEESTTRYTIKIPLI
ncbi:two-component regulator propeller domain-containing protein [Paraflavitalea sp. CAU 1676]|uniref:ligand-binding sensor domain-containing protein n=1 Tax=Paraflavitalea sp. CAU 1676 TaxID=3032598 RepID=UPI0023DC73E3|nr:two-component regulator propeller domain-containing protein [Paraflavitalea sp. CAU 1676]MDF2190358.1 two-component regulator propeller domain-containing protein [Paraflavitalea sp. CAU 1676]